MTDPGRIAAGLHRQPNIAQKGSFHASRQYSAYVLPRYRPSGSPTSLQLLLYYADWPLPAPGCSHNMCLPRSLVTR
jgi:hypothetical protein